jgi:hypothetical protein
VPETVAERVLFSLGIAIIGVLLAVIVFGRNPSDRAASATPTTAQLKTVHVTSTSHQSTLPAATTAPATTTVAQQPQTGSTTRLQVTAKDDTWLSIRRDSATGAVLFEGTLTKGDSRSYTASRFHVRFGAAANVSAKLDGQPLPLPGGTYSVTIGPSGLGTRSA